MEKLSVKALACVAFFFSVAEALDSPLALATQINPDLDQEPPRPTLSHTAGRSGKTELRRRQADGDDEIVLIRSDNTCGYTDGESAEPYTCTTGEGERCGCGLRTHANGDIGDVLCCYEERGCYSTMGCVNSVGISSSSLCDDACMSDPQWLKCSKSERPFCVTFTVGPESLNVLDIRCGSEPVNDTRILETFHSIDIAGEHTADLSYSTTRIGDIEAPRSSSNTAPAPSDTSEPEPSSAPASAIAGGVVGGLAVIALVALAIFFIRRRDRKNKKASDLSDVNDSSSPAMLPANPASSPLSSQPLSEMEGSHMSPELQANEVAAHELSAKAIPPQKLPVDEVPRRKQS